MTKLEQAGSLATFDVLLETLSTEAKRRGSEFEVLCKWLLENHPVYRRLLDRVWLWEEWPGRWGADAGIDLIARARDGGLWAIQAKAYAETNTIKRPDVDSFLAESSRSEFSYRLLIGSTNRIGSTARKTLAGQEKPAGAVLLSDLRSAALEWPGSISDLSAPAQPVKVPRDHQAKAIADVVSGFEGAARGRLIMPCGTGKTLTSLFIAERLRAKTVLLLAPSLSLLAQTLQEWVANSTQPMDFLPVCSDSTVAGTDQAVTNTSELGFPVTTDPEKIAKFLDTGSLGFRVVFSTYQSTPRLAEAMRLSGTVAFDLAISDEAHKCAGRVSESFGTILDDDAIPAARRLFMTATPRYLTSRAVMRADDVAAEVVSMDDVPVFGPEFHHLTFAQAIRDGLLTDFQVAVVGIDDETYRRWVAESQLLQFGEDEITDARTLAGQIGFAKAISDFEITKAITFHGRIDAAKRFARDLPSVIDWMPLDSRPRGTVRCDYVSGQMSSGERATKIESLRMPDTDRVVLSNARCLTEGIDVPTLDAVAFIQPRRSKVDIVQAVGRAIRTAPDKKVGTIVLPVFIGDTQDPEAAVMDSVFEPVWSVISALRAHDEELAEVLDELRFEMGRNPKEPVGLPAKIKLDLPASVSSEFVEAFKVRLVESSTEAWSFMFGLLAKYSEREGTSVVPVVHREEGRRLGAWVAAQRVRQELLDPIRRQKLESLPGWTWDYHGEAWSSGYELLLKYVSRHGHCKVPRPYIEDGRPLGSWVYLQRVRRLLLTTERREKLEALPGWEWDPRGTAWQSKFELLRDITSREGGPYVSKDHVESGVKIGAWLKSQRKKRSSLSPSQVEQLESLANWSWHAGEDEWQRLYLLLEWHIKNGAELPLPSDCEIEAEKLGAWVADQRRRPHRLNSAQRDQLESLTGWEWDPPSDRWMRSYGLLKQYVDREGHANVPQAHFEDGEALGRWVATQRKESGAKPVQAELLEALPGWLWNNIKDRWESSFQMLVGYVEREGHATVPRQHREGDYALGLWVARQRSRRSVLAYDKRKRLESFPGWHWSVHEEKWEEAYGMLLKYVEREGDASVPKTYVEEGRRLGVWVAKQRNRKAQLSEDQVWRLESLPRWRWRREDGNTD